MQLDRQTDRQTDMLITITLHRFRDKVTSFDNTDMDTKVSDTCVRVFLRPDSS